MSDPNPNDEEPDATVLKLPPAKCASPFIGQTETNIRAVSDAAKKLPETDECQIIILEEVDSDEEAEEET